MTISVDAATALGEMLRRMPSYGLNGFFAMADAFGEPTEQPTHIFVYTDEGNVGRPIPAEIVDRLERGEDTPSTEMALLIACASLTDDLP